VGASGEVLATDEPNDDAHKHHRLHEHQEQMPLYHLQGKATDGL